MTTNDDYRQNAKPEDPPPRPPPRFSPLRPIGILLWWLLKHRYGDDGILWSLALCWVPAVIFMIPGGDNYAARLNFSAIFALAGAAPLVRKALQVMLHMDNPASAKWWCRTLTGDDP